ncbi:MAG: 30S ribosomal protein S16, partial [Gammaproteobacteria bacterium]|nr:30S ribosomal protein S16 [Gammaproteobacteria bacterium]
MVRVRLSRGGAKKRPYYHIVVIDQKDRREGRCIERIGSYDPALETDERIKLNIERLEYWVSKGAQISERVKYLKKYSLDPDNLSKRQKAKEKELEKLKIKRLKKKEAEAAPAEEKEAEAAPAEEKEAEAAPAEE